MHKNLALTAIAATLIGCAPARADPTQNSCWIGGENDNIKVSGTLIMRHKRLSIKLDVPHCMGKGEKPQTYLHVEGSLVQRNWVGSHVTLDDVVWIADEDEQAITVERIDKAPSSASADLEKLSCRDIVGKGWDHMPHVADYVEAQPGADKLGYGSSCAIGSLVFSQCWLEPKWSVLKAINALLRKAATGKKLPDVPTCGA